jgi:hypothetical protein
MFYSGFFAIKCGLTAGSASEAAAVNPLFTCISLPEAGEKHFLTLSGVYLPANAVWLRIYFNPMPL